MTPEAGGRLGGEGQDVVEGELVGVDAGEFAQVALGVAGAGVVGRQAPQRQQVGLLVEAEGVVDAAVQVRGDLGHARNRAGAHEADVPVAGDQASGQAEIAVEEGVEQWPAVDLDVENLDAVAHHGGPRLELQGRGVGVGADDPEARPLRAPLGQDPGDDRAVAHGVSAPLQPGSPRLRLIGAGEADGVQARSRLGGRVVAGRGGGDEVGEAGCVGVVVAQDGVRGGGAGRVGRHGPSVAPEPADPNGLRIRDVSGRSRVRSSPPWTDCTRPRQMCHNRPRTRGAPAGAEITPVEPDLARTSEGMSS